MSPHVIVGLSGGVDSAVSALLLKRQGVRVSAIFMQNWEDDDEQCTARQDYRDAAAVAARLDMSLDTVNFADAYWERVFEHFLAEYQAGRTPNPDILCNREIKFRAFLDHARAIGAESIATGHYARREDVPGTALPDRSGERARLHETPVSGQTMTRLLRGLDPNKDQSYFLHTLDQSQVAAARFPVGALDKPAVRRLAVQAGFPVAHKKDSTGICFIGERKFRQFLADYLPAQPGDIVSDHGERLGRHHGLMFHTIGQRQGLGIGGRADAADQPWYVLHKDLHENRLVVGQGHDHPALMRERLIGQDVHWIAGKAPAERFRCTARVRYRQRDQDAHVELDDAGRIAVEFDEPVRAITAGQSVVLYCGEECLGGAVIADLDAPDVLATPAPVAARSDL